MAGAAAEEVTPPGTGTRTRWAWLVATFFGTGYLRPGPGTYGSVAAVLLWLGAAHVFHPSKAQLVLGTLAAALLVTAVGIPASTIVARESGRRDPGFVVIDEVAGQLLALSIWRPRLQYALAALALFRLFDIWKPWMIKRYEALPGGRGVMMDDLAAGCWAVIVAMLAKDLFGLH